MELWTKPVPGCRKSPESDLPTCCFLVSLDTFIGYVMGQGDWVTQLCARLPLCSAQLTKSVRLPPLREQRTPWLLTCTLAKYLQP